MKITRSRLPLLCAGAVLFAASAWAQSASTDSDNDGLSDALENALLQTFRPTLMVSTADCSAVPAQFSPGIAVPTVLKEDGTLYGQAFPRRTGAGEPQQVELHYYHLWRRDCGRLGHALDTEHVSVLLEAPADASPDRAEAWTAAYWYAAAHEDTVCDAGHLARASTLHATSKGAEIWISSGKHASFLTEEMCHHGCGGDQCLASRPAPSPPVIDLGEAMRPMNGSAWISSARWPLREKMVRSDFTPERLARLQRLPSTDIAWANPAKRPAQAAILGGNTAVDGTLKGGSAAGAAVSTGSRSTDSALTVAGSQTSSALGKATRSTGHALSKALHSVQHAVGAK